MATTAHALCDDDIRFERVTGTIGAVVHGVPLTGTDRAATAATLRRGLHEHGVLFFPYAEAVSGEDLMAFSTLFGEAEVHSGLSTGKSVTPYIDSETSPMRENRINHWHADGTPKDRPPQCALLTPVSLPDVGGDTMWASQYAAWEGLSSANQALLEGLDVRHGMARAPHVREKLTSVHPAVLRDPVTGRKHLYINPLYCERIVGMSDHESESLLQMLFAHVNSPEYHVRLRWRMGMVAVWEERVTLHRGVADFDGPRRMWRITLQGERPAR